MSRTKPVEWEKEFDKMFVYEPNTGRVLYRPSPLLVPIPYIKEFISSLLQEQAEHFVKLGEGLKNKHTWKGMRPQTFNNIKSVGYQEAISDFQKAIKKEGK